jgi:hypothetical protein
MEKINDINKISKYDKIAIMLRGHVRSSFDDNKLYNFLNLLTKEYNIDIYIYTFNVKNAGKIYKIQDREESGKIITEKDVKDYLRDLIEFTKEIIVDCNGTANLQNDKYIGNISKNKFLHMWNSIHNVIKIVKNTNINYVYAINMRLDYFQLEDKFSKQISITQMKRLFYIDVIEDFIRNIDKTQNFCLTNIVKKEKEKEIFSNKNKLIKSSREKKEKNLKILLNIKYDNNDILYGIDNLFAGNIEYLYKLSYTFVNYMDDIFEFLGQIIEDLSTYSKIHGGCGGPHEAILPLFIKNKFDFYLQNCKFE